MFEGLQVLGKKILHSDRVKCSAGENIVLLEEENLSYPEKGTLDEVENRELRRSSNSTNRPPSFDTFMNSIKAITKNYDHVKGFRFDVGIGLSRQFNMIHSWNIINTQTMKRKANQAGYYLFMGQFMNNHFNTVGGDSSSFIMTGRLDSRGKLESAMIKNLTTNLILKWTVGYQNNDPNRSQSYFDLDWQGENYTHTFKWGSGIWGMNFMQTIGQNLVLGYEIINVANRNKPFMGFSARYTRSKHSFYALYQEKLKEVSLAYVQRISKNAQLVNELLVSTANKHETQCIFGYRQRFFNTEVTVTAHSKGKVASVINILGGELYQLKLCATANYRKDTYKFGYGISFGQT